MTERAANRLAGETSPYLLQHAHNPVDWYPWGPEALERSRSEKKPIFLSIGYSACHWCHVMERESFENERVAALMNERFVNVKVDREERPDLDEIYMKAVQALTGSGGWPMSVFLTPELEPFFGGTYFPPFGAHGRPGFADVLLSLSQAWDKTPDKVVQQASRLTEQITREARMDTRGALAPDALDRSLAMIEQSFDAEWGGFGGAPKFPHATDIRLLLRHHLRTGRPHVRQMATLTLDRMARGGVYDQLGGGFHRYSVDDEWRVPHFEKMLYDNALLVPAYLEGHLVTQDPVYARVARECCEWALREMLTPEGAFASTQDADSEGEEGRFFVWTPDQLREVLGKQRARLACEWWNVTQDGNFEDGKNVLWRPEPREKVAERLSLALPELEAEMEDARQSLLVARAERVRPGTDDKVLAAWNGLMISALAQAHQVLDRDDFLHAARAAARYVLQDMRQDDGRLFATARGGRAHHNGCLDDYAFMIQGLIDLYESDFDPAWIRAALELSEVLEERFLDEKLGGYFTTGKGHEPLIARLKNPHDGALPAGNGVQALNLLRLAELTGQGTLAQRAENSIVALGGLANRYPSAFSSLLTAADFLASGPREVVIAGRKDDPGVAAMLRAVRGRFQPQRVVALADEDADKDLMPLLDDKPAGPGGARAYVCQSYACRAPVDSVEELLRELA